MRSATLVGSDRLQKRSYESMTVRVDVQGALSGSQREERLAFIAVRPAFLAYQMLAHQVLQGTESMSRGADPNAPTRASAEALMASYRDKSMIEWHEGKNRAVSNVCIGHWFG